MTHHTVPKQSIVKKNAIICLISFHNDCNATKFFAVRVHSWCLYGQYVVICELQGKWNL